MKINQPNTPVELQKEVNAGELNPGNATAPATIPMYMLSKRQMLLKLQLANNTIQECNALLNELEEGLKVLANWGLSVGPEKATPAEFQGEFWDAVRDFSGNLLKKFARTEELQKELAK